ncbi:MAG: hypothetical protein AAF561_11060 [Planctomycetota bacterium]
MLLQTNSYLVPRHRLREHDDLMRQFVACFRRLGVADGAFEVFQSLDHEYRQHDNQPHQRITQILRFRDHDQQQAVHRAEASDPEAAELVEKLRRLVDLDEQAARKQFTSNYYGQIILTGSPQASAPANDDEIPVGERVE